MVEKMYKFMQSLSADVYRQLAGIADERGITIQELIRAIIVPEWMKFSSHVREHRHDSEHLHHETRAPPIAE